MINRILIRLKIVQLLYAYYQNGDKSIDSAVKELRFSLSKAYDLYNLLLLLMVKVTQYALDEVEKKENYNKITHTDEVVSRKFVDNAFIMQLERNKQLKEYVESHKLDWSGADDYLKYLYGLIIESDYYKEYILTEKSDYAEDRELWRRIYRFIIMKDEKIDEVLEDMSLYWNDDKEIVDTFVLKTIKRFEKANGSNQELVEEYKDDEDMEYAERLFRKTIIDADQFRMMISQNTRNWEFDRLAYMDVVIMQVALCEMLNFPNIPVSVTINEYVEIAKCYSTPKSGGYVNGLLDHIAHWLRDNRMITKA